VQEVGLEGLWADCGKTALHCKKMTQLLSFPSKSSGKMLSKEEMSAE